ncbi:MAG: hypothetical protein WBQ72_12990 [Terriglobales bacterium]|jgi:hypothetical protein
MPFLSEVLEELRLSVSTKVKDGNETLLLITRSGLRGIIRTGFRGFPPPPEHCYTLAVRGDDNPFLSEAEAAAIRRHFKPSKRDGFIELGLSD